MYFKTRRGTHGPPASESLAQSRREHATPGQWIIRSLLRRLIVTTVALVACLPLLAQQGPDNDPDGAQGYVNNVFHHSEVDSVNLYNGQLAVPIEIGPSYPIGPKLKLQLMLTYGSRIWEFGHPSVQSPDGTSTPLAGDPAVGIGWTFTLGAVKVCKNWPPGTGRMCYFGPDGSQHAFDAVDSSRGFNYYKTSDASQLSLRNVGSDASGEGPFEMWDGDGNHHVFGWRVSGFDDDLSNFTHDFGRGRDGWYLTSLSDPFGNGYSVSYRTGLGPCWTYSMSCTYQGMHCPAISMNLWIPQAITLPTAPPNNVITISTDASQMITGFNLPVSGGGAATWSLTYQTEAYPEFCGGGFPVIQPNLREIQTLRLPNGIGSYQFSYTNGSNCVKGLLTHFQVPTGATIDYLYGYYSFYHGRLAALNQNCNPIGPDPSALVEVSGPNICFNSPVHEASRAPAIGGGSCTDPVNYLDQQLGVLKRTETVSGSSSVTDYVQFAFPFGEQGTAPRANCDTLGRCGPQSLTVAVFPADVDGRRRARGVLFWSAPKNPNQAGAYAGERTGAEIEERVYDSDPTQGVNLTMPVCGGAVGNPICADHAVRVTQRTYEYDIPTSEVGNRRLLSEIAYHQPPAANDVCSGCRYHATVFSNLGGRTWEGNGRHYNIETHSGNLGNDTRSITTDWAPRLTAVWLPNLYASQIESDPSLSINKYSEFDVNNGFLRGTLLHDAPRARAFLTCRYKDGAGNVGQEFSATYTNQPTPVINACATYYPTIPNLPANGDAFGKTHTYQNGLRTSTRWINGSTPANWYSKLLTRDSSTGWIASFFDSAGLATNYAYDALGRVTSIFPPGETLTLVTYPSTTRTIATRSGGPGLNTYQEDDYDGLGRLTREVRLMPGGIYAVRAHAFDGAGHSILESEWASCASPGGDCQTASPGGTRDSNFDPFGRAQTLTHADGSTQLTSYADTYSPYSDTLKTVTTSCVNGTWSGGTCGGGGAPSTTSASSDAFGRVTSVTEPGGDVTTYGHDLNGKLVSVNQGPPWTRTFEYDPAGFLRRQVTPEGGTVTFDQYGSLGNVLQETRPGGLVLTRTYDYAGRLKSVTSNEGGARTYLLSNYDEPNGFSLGKLTSRTAFNFGVSPTATVSDTFTYGGVGGRLSTRQTVIAGSSSLTASQSWQYNSLGLRAHYAHSRASGNAPFIVSTTYDAGHPVTIYADGIPIVRNVTYHPSGAIGSYTTGIGIGHNVTTNIVSDPSLLPRPARISAVEQASASTLFDTQTYAYDGAGNIMAMGMDIFSYDPRSRLTSAALGGVGFQGYNYDRYGNLLSKGGTTFCVSNCLNNRLPSASYDARGNILAYGSDTYTYDGLDRISNNPSTGWAYLYDGEGERTTRVPTSGNWTYTFRDEERRAIAEYAGPVAARDRVFLGHFLVASYANASVGGNGPVWTFYSSDHLGTPRLVTDVAGAAVETRRYWPYGEDAAFQSSFERIRFAGMERDPEGNRYYDHARSHDFGIGRFLSPDVLQGKPFTPQSWNRYAYAGLNPLTSVDPDGFDGVKRLVSRPTATDLHQKAVKEGHDSYKLEVKVGVKVDGVPEKQQPKPFYTKLWGNKDLEPDPKAWKVKRVVFEKGKFVTVEVTTATDGTIIVRANGQIVKVGPVKIQYDVDARANVPKAIDAGITEVQAKATNGILRPVVNQEALATASDLDLTDSEVNPCLYGGNAKTCDPGRWEKPPD